MFILHAQQEEVPLVIYMGLSNLHYGKPELVWVFLWYLSCKSPPPCLFFCISQGTKTYNSGIAHLLLLPPWAHRLHAWSSQKKGLHGKRWHFKYISPPISQHRKQRRHFSVYSHTHMQQEQCSPPSQTSKTSHKEQLSCAASCHRKSQMPKVLSELKGNLVR